VTKMRGYSQQKQLYSHHPCKFRKDPVDVEIIGQTEVVKNNKKMTIINTGKTSSPRSAS